MIEFKLPELGENIEQGDLVRLMISPGSSVSTGQAVMELETDKAVVEVPSSVSGTVQEVRVKEGEKIKVGQVIFTVENGSGAKAAGESSPGKKAPASSRGEVGVQSDQKSRGQGERPASSAPISAPSGTGIGSLPGQDMTEAIRTVMGELGERPGMPFLPELPRRGVGEVLVGLTDELHHLTDRGLLPVLRDQLTDRLKRAAR